MLAEVVRADIHPDRRRVATRPTIAEVLDDVSRRAGGAHAHWLADRRAGVVLAVTIATSAATTPSAQTGLGRAWASIEASHGIRLRSVQPMSVVSAHPGTGAASLRWGRAVWLEGLADPACPGHAAHVAPTLFLGAGAHLWLGDPTTGTALAIGLWHSRDDRDAAGLGERHVRAGADDDLGGRVFVVQTFDEAGPATDQGSCPTGRGLRPSARVALPSAPG